MPGAVDGDMGLDDGALDTEFSIGGTELLLFKQMGAATVDGIQLRFTGSIQRDDTGEVQAVELVVRGVIKRWIPASGKPARAAPPKVSSTNSCCDTCKVALLHPFSLPARAYQTLSVKADAAVNYSL